MKKRKIFLGLLLASAAVVGVASCNSKKDSDADNNKSSDVTEEKVTVTFNTNGGSNVSSAEITKGGKVTRPTNPTKANNDFDGWYSDANLTNAFNFDTAINEDITLYAKWIATAQGSQIYTIQFESNGGSDVTSQQVEEGHTVTEPGAPTKQSDSTNAYTFEGWYTDQALTQRYDFSATVDHAFTLYAKYTATPLTVSYFVIFNTGVDDIKIPAAKVTAGATAERPADPERAAEDDKHLWRLEGWYSDAAFTEKFDFSTPINKATQLYAKWVEYQKIENVEDFLAFRQLESSTGAFLLTADIDLEGVASADLDSAKNAFGGIFDGDGHTIKNAIYADAASNKTGFLVKDMHDATVTNVKFSNCVSNLNAETISLIAGMGGGKLEFSKIEFNGCSVQCQNYAGLLLGRVDTAKTTINISEITCKNGCKSTVTNYGGTLIGDVDKTDSSKRTEINITNCDLDIELVGSNQNGGFLSGRLRANTNLNIKDVVIRNAVLPEKTGLICGGGDNNATNSTVTVENLYVMNTNAKLLQSCALQTGTNPVTSFSITYTNSYMDAASLENIIDNVINGTTYLQSVDKANTNVAWLKDTLKLDFDGAWTTEEQDATKYRLTASSTNVKSPDATIERLKATTANAQVRFEKGTEFSAAGLAVTGIYSDGVNLVLANGADDGYEIISTDYNKDVAGKYTITIKSKEDPTVTTTYEVEVVALVEFDVDANYAKLTYMVGEELDVSNLVVYGTWTDGKRLLFKNYTTNAASLDMTTAGAKQLKVSVAGQPDAVIRISVIDTKPVIVDNYAYINVDQDADVDYAGQLVDGVETFNTINEALEYLISANLGADVNKVIYVADGVYHEKLTVSAKLSNLKIIGESRDNTIIEYDAVEDTVDPISGNKFVMNCATLHVNAEGFGLENITVNNTFDYIKDHTKYGNPQGFALTIAADRAVIDNVTLYGNQDTLFFKKGRVYLNNCEIDGNIDFIFGENDGIAFFNQCTIKAIGKATTPENNNGYVTAMKGDATNHPTYGYVFYKCNFTDDGNVKEGAMSLGRPWGAGASVAMIECEFSAAYSKLGYDGSTKSRWFDMSGNKPQNAHFTEYGSTGDGAIDTAVTGGSILTQDEAGNYTAANTLATKNGGVDWGSVEFKYLQDLAALQAAQNKTAATDILVFLDGSPADDTLTVAKDDLSKLVAVPVEWNAVDKSVRVDIDDESVATYSNGVISGLELGTTTIYITIDSVVKTMTLEVIELPSYTIQFVTDGSAVADQTVKKYKTVDEAAATTTLANSVFKGWFLDENYEEEYDFTTKVTSDLVLYAKLVNWADMYKENIVVYFNGTEGDGVDTFTFVGYNGAQANVTADSCGIIHTAKLLGRAPANPDAQFNNGCDASFDVAANATIILTARNLNGTTGFTIKLDDTTLTPTVSADGLTYTIEVERAGKLHIINDGGKNAYLSSLSVTYPEVIEETTKINFGSNGDYTTATALDQSGATYGQIQGACNQIMKDSVLVFYVNPGATIHISGNWSVGYSINGEEVLTTNAGGTDNTGLEHDYYCEVGGKVVITSLHNNNYFYYISVTYPSKITESIKIQFGTSGNAAGVIDGVTMSGVTNRDAGDAQIKNGKITLTLEKAATITIAGNWSVDYTINGTVVQSKQVTGADEDEANLNYVYEASAGTVEIVVGDTSKCYFYYIDVVME